MYHCISEIFAIDMSPVVIRYVCTNDGIRQDDILIIYEFQNQKILQYQYLYQSCSNVIVDLYVLLEVVYSVRARFQKY